jgi:uncharacterized protein YecT (DUF1311 family)
MSETVGRKNGDKRLQELCGDLFDANKRAFAQRQYSVAFHALAAAYHAALALSDIEGLRRVEKLSREQLAWIDENAQHYEHSTESAKTRGHHSVYATLASQASTRGGMLDHERKYLGLR